MQRCGIIGKPGKRPCRKHAGHGVEGVHSGPCSLHGGNLPHVKRSTIRAELLQEARALATDPQFVGDPAELMLAQVRLTMAHAILIERLIEDLPEDADQLGWRRLLESAQRTAAHTSARAISLGLEEHRMRRAEQLGGVFSMAFEDVYGLFRQALGDEVTAPLKAKAMDVWLLRLESFEAQGYEELPEIAETAA